MTSKRDLSGEPVEDAVQVAVVTDITDDVTCSNGDDCMFAYKDSLTPQIAGSALTANKIEITGTGFGTDVGKLTIELSGVE